VQARKADGHETTERRALRPHGSTAHAPVHPLETSPIITDPPLCNPHNTSRLSLSEGGILLNAPGLPAHMDLPMGHGTGNPAAHSMPVSTGCLFGCEVKEAAFAPPLQHTEGSSGRFSELQCQQSVPMPTAAQSRAKKSVADDIGFLIPSAASCEQPSSHTNHLRNTTSPEVLPSERAPLTDPRGGACMFSETMAHLAAAVSAQPVLPYSDGPAPAAPVADTAAVPSPHPLEQYSNSSVPVATHAANNTALAQPAQQCSDRPVVAAHVATTATGPSAQLVLSHADRLNAAAHVATTGAGPSTQLVHPHTHRPAAHPAPTAASTPPEECAADMLGAPWRSPHTAVQAQPPLPVSDAADDALVTTSAVASEMAFEGATDVSEAFCASAQRS
jgi:hypothetical protein